MPRSRTRVLLVEVTRSAAEMLHKAMRREADLIEVDATQARSRLHDGSAERGSLLVVIGPHVPDPIGLLHALRSERADLVAIVLGNQSSEARLSGLSLLLPDQQVRWLPLARVGQLPGMAREMVEQISRYRVYSAARTAAQQQLDSSKTIRHQLGEQLFGEFLTQADIGAVMLDGTGSLIAWNNKAADVLALDEAEALEQPLADLFPEPDRATLNRHLASPAENRRTDSDAVFERTRRDGSTQSLRLAPQRVLDNAGNERTLVLVEDVTARLRAQRQLAERTRHTLLNGEIAATMTASGSLSQRLHRCTRAIVEHLEVPFARIWLLRSGDVLDLAAESGEQVPLEAAPTRVRLNRSTIGAIAAGRRPRSVRGVEPAPGDEVGIPAPFNGYPMVSGGELMGVLAVATPQLSRSALDTLEGIADQIAVGVQQDLLLQQLRATTEALQRPLLPPHLPELPGFDLAARYHPYGRGLDVGGDFYDVFPVQDGRHVLVVGDVCGKGPEAAGVTGLVRHTLWTAAQHAPDPGHVLPVVDQALRRESSPFCTLVYALMDITGTSARLQVACAGHPPPLLRRRGGTTRAVGGQGPLLGVSGLAPQKPAEEVELLPGDALVCYTDGFLEGAGSLRQREVDELADLVSDHSRADSDRPAERLADFLLDEAFARWGEQLRDDLAVLALAAPPPST